VVPGPGLPIEMPFGRALRAYSRAASKTQSRRLTGDGLAAIRG
jgi:hypothetical protein